MSALTGPRRISLRPHSQVPDSQGFGGNERKLDEQINEQTLLGAVGRMQ